MSIILGINCLHADSSACLIKDGKLLLQLRKNELMKNIPQTYQCNQLGNV